MISKKIDDFIASTQMTYWKGIEMLPVIHEYIESEIDDARAQLDVLISVKDEAYELEPCVVESILSRFSKRIVQRYQIEEQCRLWSRLDLLSNQQKETIKILEQNITYINKLSQQILFFVKHFEKKVTMNTHSYSTSLLVLDKMQMKGPSEYTHST
jgi:glutathionylspermidine synthase